MGASVSGYWPGITEEQLDSMPGFFNDDKAYGDWMANRVDAPDALEAIAELGCSAVLTYTTDGVPDDEVDWVTPEELRVAALKLRELVLEKDPRTGAILESYASGANGLEPLHEELARDLGDVAQIAEYASAEGVAKMTLEVNW